MLKQRLLIASSHSAPSSPGSLYAFGSNGTGAIGDGTTMTVTTPTKIGANTTWAKVFGCHGNSDSYSDTTNKSFSFAIRTNGTLWAAGSNSTYGTGLGTNSGNTTTWTQVGSATNWLMVSANAGGNGNNWALGIRTDGTLWGWGINGESQLGDGTTTTRTTPTQIGSATNWVWVSTAGASGVDSFTVGVTSDGKLWSWGSNASGATAQGTTSGTITSPTQIGSLTTWKQVAASASYGAALSPNAPTGFMLAVKTDGTMWGCGINQNSNIDNTGTDYTTVTQIGSNTTWDKVYAGWAMGMAIRTNGTLWSWGVNAGGCTAQGTISGRTTSPTQVGSATNWVSISLGNILGVGGFGNGLTSDGKLWAWGTSSQYNLGNGSASGTLTAPTQVGSKTDWIYSGAGGLQTSSAYSLAIALT